MKRSFKRARMLAIAVGCACALMAASAAAASAAPAYWVNPGTPSATGTLTLKLAGTNEKTCTPISTFGGSAANFEGVGSVLSLWNNAAQQMQFNCTGGTSLWMSFGGSATYESGYWLSNSPSSSLRPGPYGSYQQVATKSPWTNAAEGKDSSFAFSGTKIGIYEGKDMTATGTITVKRNNGETLTLKH